jgi:hypothetical protein
MNKVMHLDMDRFGPVICTLNPTISIKEESIQARGNYEHPTFNAEVRRHLQPIKSHTLTYYFSSPPSSRISNHAG